MVKFTLARFWLFSALVLGTLAAPVTGAMAQVATPRRGATAKIPTAKSRPSITAQMLEGPADTITFHIGSPLFLRMQCAGDPRLCTPRNGQFFYFDATNAQLGWGFEEVTDSLLFPGQAAGCYRIVMLSSENSNRLAEGYYTFKATVYFDSKRSATCNTLVLHPVHSATGADPVSYLRFLREQILKNAPMLRDPATLQALFGAEEFRSAESDLYYALTLHRVGDNTSATDALNRSDAEYARTNTARSPYAELVRTELRRRLGSAAAAVPK